MTSFIDQIAIGDAIGAKSTMSDMLSAKAFEALDTRKQELAATLFTGNEQKEEEVEFTQEEYDQLDELSKSTLGSYVKKASDDAAKSASGSTSFAFRSSAAKNPRVKDAAAKYSDEEHSRKEKRLTGIGTAVKKLTK